MPAERPTVAQEFDLLIPENNTPHLDTIGRHPYSPQSESFDPLLVKNIDVADLQRREHIEKLRMHIDGIPKGLELDGLIRTNQYVPVIDSEGKQQVDQEGNPVYEFRAVVEYAFKGHKRPYRAGEKVEGTDWVIPEDWQPIERVRSPLRRRNPQPVEPQPVPDLLPPGYMPPAQPQPS